MSREQAMRKAADWLVLGLVALGLWVLLTFAPASAADSQLYWQCKTTQPVGWCPVTATKGLPVSATGAVTYNTAANTTGAQVATGPGVLRSLTINTAGLTSSATFYDGTSTSGTKLGTFSTLVQGSIQLNWAFTTGLFVVLAGGTPANVTVGY